MTQGTAKDPMEFHLKEWEFLRVEIRTQIEHSKNLEFATLVGLGAFYAWFMSSAKPLPHFILLVPSLLVLLAALRSWGTLRNIQRNAVYVRLLEEHLSLNKDGLIGWDRTRDRLPNKSSELKASASLFWIAAVVVNGLAWRFL